MMQSVETRDIAGDVWRIPEDHPLRGALMACPEFMIKQSDIDNARWLAIGVTVVLLIASASMFFWALR